MNIRKTFAAVAVAGVLAVGCGYPQIHQDAWGRDYITFSNGRTMSCSEMLASWLQPSRSAFRVDKQGNLLVGAPAYTPEEHRRLAEAHLARHLSARHYGTTDLGYDPPNPIQPDEVGRAANLCNGR